MVDLPCVFSWAEGLEEIDPRPRMQGSAAIDVCGKELVIDWVCRTQISFPHFVVTCTHDVRCEVRFGEVEARFLGHKSAHLHRSCASSTAHLHQTRGTCH